MKPCPRSPCPGRHPEQHRHCWPTRTLPDVALLQLGLDLHGRRVADQSPGHSPGDGRRHLTDLGVDLQRGAGRWRADARSAAASASDSSARPAVTAASWRVGAGRLSTDSALRRATREVSRRSCALATASRALSTSAWRGTAGAASLSQPVVFLATDDQLALGAGDVVLGCAAILGEAARALVAIAIAATDGELGGRGVHAGDQLAVVETDQDLAGAAPCR